MAAAAGRDEEEGEEEEGAEEKKEEDAMVRGAAEDVMSLRSFEKDRVVRIEWWSIACSELVKVAIVLC